MAKLGVGVLGVGEMGRRHAENIRRLVPEARLVAVADVAAGRAKQAVDELEIERSFSSLEEMLECKELDALVIATPDKFHAKAIEVAAAAGKDILCEKPLAINRADAHSALRAVANAAYQANINGMLFYTNTIHDFDLARWLMRDEVTEVQAYTTVAIRPELADYGDVVASVVNLKFARGAIGNIESHAQAIYGYDVRSEIVGSKGSIFIGRLEKTPATFLSASGGASILADHFLSRFADAYVSELRDFVHNMLHDRPPCVTGEDGLRALEIAIAAEESHVRGMPRKVETSNLEQFRAAEVRGGD